MGVELTGKKSHLSDKRVRPTWLSARGKRRATALVVATAAALGVGASSASAVVARQNVRPTPRTAPALSTTDGPSARSAETNTTCTVSGILVPSCGMWWGVSPGTYKDRQQGVNAFEQTTNSRVDIYHAYHFLGQLFPNPQEVAIANQAGHKRLLLLDYVPDGSRTWAQVAAGANDAKLDQEAAYIESHFTQKFFISIHHEPEDEVRSAGSGYTAADFASMYRHVVDRFRRDGVTNVVWVWNIMGVQAPDTQPWFAALYPGDSYVDWIAGDPYGCFTPKVCNDFDTSTINQRFSPKAPWPGFYNWATKAHPGKPLMLAEWGAFTNSGETARVKYLNTARPELSRFPALKALVYWDSTDARRGDVHLAPGSAAAAAVRNLVGASQFSVNAP